MRRVLDDWYPQPIIVPQVALLAAPLWYALDLLDLLDFKASILAEVAFDEKRDEDGPLRVCVNAAAGAALEGSHEEGCAGGGLEDLVGKLVCNYKQSKHVVCFGQAYLWSAEVFLAVEVHHEHVGGLHELFLHTTGCDVDFVFMTDTCSASCTCDLALSSC